MAFFTNFLLVVFLFFIPPDKGEMKKAVKRKTAPDGSSQSWYTRNDDSCFYKADTIRLFYNSNYMYHSGNACNFILWNFGKNKFVSLSEKRICQEPPVAICCANSGHYYMKQEKDKLFLIIENKSSKQKFQIIDLKEVELWEKGDKCQEMTLVRIK